MKLKKSIKKKVLTSLLIGATLGTTLTGISGNTAFADNKTTDLSRSELVSVSSSVGKNLINEMNKNRASVVLYEVYGTPFTFVHANGRLYLYDSSSGGGFRKGLATVNGHTFLFNNTRCYSEVGWYNLSGYGRLYLQPNKYETPKDCFMTIGSENFHFNDKGTVDKGLVAVEGHTYCFDKKSGVQRTGWWSEGSHRYFFDNDYYNGAAHIGWYRDGQAGDVCFDENGWMREGLQYIDGNIYLFQHHGKGANSYTASGFYTNEKTLCRYYFDPQQGNKALRDTWLDTGYAYYKRGNGKMYFYKDGHMANGVSKIHGETYLFLQPDIFNGDRLNAFQCTGWYTDPFTHNRYYFNPECGGAARSISNTPEGAAVKGVQYIDGQRYVFDNNGVLIG